jgi:hypothetical protein
LGISHLLFADDSLLFFEALVEQATVIKSVLDRYEEGIGQLVSMGKCSVMYGDGCSPDTQAQLKSILQYETECFEEKYLRLPVPEGRLTKGKFKTSKGKISKHASDWAEKYMSSGAKETLISLFYRQYRCMTWACSNFPLV